MRVYEFWFANRWVWGFRAYRDCKMQWVCLMLFSLTLTPSLERFTELVSLTRICDDRRLRAKKLGRGRVGLDRVVMMLEACTIFRGTTKYDEERSDGGRWGRSRRSSRRLLFLLHALYSTEMAGVFTGSATTYPG